MYDCVTVINLNVARVVGACIVDSAPPCDSSRSLVPAYVRQLRCDGKNFFFFFFFFFFFLELRHDSKHLCHHFHFRLHFDHFVHSFLSRNALWYVCILSMS
jgi:hypothetical protein